MLSPEALAFVDALHRELNPERERLLAARGARQGKPRFVRAPQGFTVSPAPADLQDRRVEITGPVCYCVSGQPTVLSGSSTALSATYTCTGTCPDAKAPGVFLIIAANYTYRSLMPLYSRLANPTVAQTVTVQLQ